MNRIVSAIVFSLVLISGCSLTPAYHPPEAPIPQTWPEGDAYGLEATGTQHLLAPNLGWNVFFTDPGLQQIIQTALDNNRDMQLSLLNVKKAAALYGIQKAELFPSVNTTGGMNRQRIPADLTTSGLPNTTEIYSVNLGIASWEIDFFGRIRSLEDRALEIYMETEEARRSVQIVLISATAGAWLNLAADREKRNLAEITLQTQQDILSLIQRRYRAGLANDVDVNRAQTQVDVARGDIALFTQRIALDENALSLLLGKPVPADVLSVNLSEILAPGTFHSGLSSDILLKRPDILAAEHRLKAANANIGAARAALFPRISLTTTLGTASSDLSGLFGSSSATWGFVPQITAPIFDARLWSAYDAARIENEISLKLYEKAIQTAFREVADALAVNGTVGEQLAAQASLVNATETIYRLANARYDKGIDSYLSVLDAQRSMYAARQGLVTLRLLEFSARVKLYAVLGGGA